MGSLFDVIAINDISIVLVDLDKGRSVTNDASNVIRSLQETIPGGIGRRRVCYRDTMGRFDEMVIEDEKFAKFAPCTDQQQEHLSRLVKTSQETNNQETAY